MAMIKQSTEFYIPAVCTAILNKYRDTSPGKIAEAVATIVDEIKGDSECGLISRLRPVRSVLDDIKNQTVVLTLVDVYWCNPPKLDRPLTTLNASSFGRSTPTFRVSSHVEDFGGEVPTPKREIRARLDELERLCKQSVRCMGDSRLEDKAWMLAHIFGSLIRIHPFEDGNGRTARLFVFYALRCWGLPLFPIPKVRNNRRWKLALDSAVTGDAPKLKQELYWRMEKALKSLGSKRTLRINLGCG